MKTFIYFCITSMFSAGALLATLSMSNPWPLRALVVAAWVVFIWGVGKRDREEQRRREREDKLDEWLRTRSSGGRHY